MVLAACSNNVSGPVSNPDASGTGGTLGAGGQSTGGEPGSGGAASGGSTVGTGGTALGGSSSVGGVVGSGGAASTGGRAAPGGSMVTGGASATGGVTGGSSGGSTGGASGTGGASNARDAGLDTARDTAVVDTRPAGSDTLTLTTDATNTTAVTVYVAGDSTVSTYTNSAIHQAGWGQFLQNYFVANAKVVNKAVGGMTARHYIEAGYLDQIVAAIKAGDYLLVQFGTNDSNTTATYTLPGSTTAIPYYLAAATDFKTYLTKYVDATKAKGATTIFVTPPPRHSCSAGGMGVANGLAAYATAMKELGPTLGTPVVDSNAMIIAYLANVTCETSGSTFYLVTAAGTTDGTHFQETGANVIAGLIAKGTSGISTLNLPLSVYVK
jgi:lysophospholipase L1-like esterase